MAKRIQPDGHNPGLPLDGVEVGNGVLLGVAVDEAVGEGRLVLVAVLASVGATGPVAVMER